ASRPAWSVSAFRLRDGWWETRTRSCGSARATASASSTTHAARRSSCSRTSIPCGGHWSGRLRFSSTPWLRDWLSLFERGDAKARRREGRPGRRGQIGSEYSAKICKVFLWLTRRFCPTDDLGALKKPIAKSPQCSPDCTLHGALRVSASSRLRVQNT